jgi:hypothetical protein
MSKFERFDSAEEVALRMGESIGLIKDRAFVEVFSHNLQLQE